MITGRIVRVQGQIQGVGFRPFVWGLAQRCGVRGFVLNDQQGVSIHAAGDGLEAFTALLRESAPPLARIDKLEWQEARFAALPEAFEIRPSAVAAGHEGWSGIAPDVATCAQCRAEVFSDGRRQAYAFTNCTQCGPRYSIVRALPYDRNRTSMARFDMCRACSAEYGDPADRRFHAQPIACPACGPRLWYEEGGVVAEDDPIPRAAARLQAGAILAIKGLGGFHLACDARNDQSLARLRQSKQRPTKPFALMGQESALEEIVILSAATRALLRDPAAVIALAPSRGLLPQAVAPGLATLGVMLPYTPLHHLLFAHFDGALVMTSGNRSSEPQAIDNDEARARLSCLVDGFLLHDRQIVRRLDDGLERAEPPMVLRRARGRAPNATPLPAGFAATPQILALGGNEKNTICLVKNNQAFLSQHIGDLEDASTLEAFHKTIAEGALFFRHCPQRVAIDLHPGYRSSAFGQTMGLPVTRVQHHHAHLAACLGENGWSADGPAVAGIVLDGAGFGLDGTIWGGELLLGAYRSFERIAYLRPAPLAGGDRAALEPWRNLLVRLDQAEIAPDSYHEALLRLFADKPVAALRAALRANLNAPFSSSAGRLFDAVAAALDLCRGLQSYEGEAASRLEAIACDAEPYPFETTGRQIDPAPMIRALLADLTANRAKEEIAGAFHAGLARAFCAKARSLVEAGKAQAVALTGGCFQNARLLKACLAELADLQVLTHRTLPPHDGALALGQALVCLQAESN